MIDPDELQNMRDAAEAALAAAGETLHSHFVADQPRERLADLLLALMHWSDQHNLSVDDVLDQVSPIYLEHVEP